MPQVTLKKCGVGRLWHLHTLFLHSHLNIKYLFTSVFLSSTFILKTRLELLACGKSHQLLTLLTSAVSSVLKGIEAGKRGLQKVLYFYEFFALIVCCCCFIPSFLTLQPHKTVAHWTLLSMGFPMQEYWGRLPFPSPRDLPKPEIEPASPALQADSLPLSHQGRW